MIKKILKISIPIFILVAIVIMGYKIVVKINHKKEVEKHIKYIPKFSFKTVGGEVFTNADLKNNIPTVFIYFNTECEFCQEETEQILTFIDRFKKTQIVYISFEDPKIIRTFSKKYKLDNYNNIYFLCDNKMDFTEIFDVTTLPTIVIYDKDKELIEKIIGQVSVNKILKKMNI